MFPQMSFQNLESSTIDIGQSDGNITGSGLFLLTGLFFNDNSTINIDRVAGMGVDMQQDADLRNTNSAEINVGMNGGINTIQIYGFSVFGYLSNSSSTININNTKQAAIYHRTGAITNVSNGQINIGTSGGARNILGPAIDTEA